MPRRERHGNPNFPNDFVFDTNAVRALASLEIGEWTGIYESCKVQGLVAGWIPWVIVEITGTNLRRRALDNEGLRELIVAANRYDQLCEGQILPSPYALMWTAIHELADMEAPPFPSDSGTSWLRRLDLFISLKSTEQVEAEMDGDRDVIIKYSDLEHGWGIVIPENFEEYAAKKIESLKKNPAYHASADRHNLAWEYFSDWFVYTLRALGVPREVRQAVVDKDRATIDHILKSPFQAGLIEGWYIAERALGLASAVEENDGVDIAIASYLPVSALLITNDRRLGHMARGMVHKAEQGRIKTFRDFQNDVAVPVWRSGPN